MTIHIDTLNYIDMKIYIDINLYIDMTIHIDIVIYIDINLYIDTWIYIEINLYIDTVIYIDINFPFYFCCWWGYFLISIKFTFDKLAGMYLLSAKIIALTIIIQSYVCLKMLFYWINLIICVNLANLLFRQ